MGVTVGQLDYLMLEQLHNVAIPPICPAPILVRFVVKASLF